MKTLSIKIKEYNDIVAFVQESCKTVGDVTVKRGKYVIDGKSLFGVLSINMAEGAVVEYPDTAADLDEFLKRFS